MNIHGTKLPRLEKGGHLCNAWSGGPLWISSKLISKPGLHDGTDVPTIRFQADLVMRTLKAKWGMLIVSLFPIFKGHSAKTNVSFLVDKVKANNLTVSHIFWAWDCRAHKHPFLNKSPEIKSVN